MKADFLVCSCAQAGFSRFTPNVSVGIHPLLDASFLSNPGVSVRTSQIALAGCYPDLLIRLIGGECSDFPPPYPAGKERPPSLLW